MLKFAIIGTNWITERYVQAALATEQWQLAGVYSRSMTSAERFASQFVTEPNTIQCYDQLDALAKATTIDAVYIASPNSLHHDQAMQMMAAGKHVICEKPLGSNRREVEALYAAAKQYNVVLFEAFKTDYLPNMAILKECLPKLGPIHKAVFNYCQYSSRYQKYLNGENPNTFNPAFSNGSLVDIGFYCVATAASLFSAPTSVTATARLLDSGVDGHGTVMLRYLDFDVVIQHSKVSDSGLHSEIQGEEGTLIIEQISELDKIWWKPRGEQAQLISVDQFENSMQYEAAFFAEQVLTGMVDREAVMRSKLTSRILTEARSQTGVIFPADEVV
ncbi:Gfo/Idh/MocA family protein [Thaumasiovibrio subtropicus]|uniref:Gfo/Idh/MocA family protein n=1 Tax=Thaumasiovibrio subtropicus TaxID=1891207 RepID=UPI000B35A829|nr:Gfo/Idh/MocA family oxidoreductase [Thaumasiovibrio subtropicus]